MTKKRLKTIEEFLEFHQKEMDELDAAVGKRRAELEAELEKIKEEAKNMYNDQQ